MRFLDGELGPEVILGEVPPQHPPDRADAEVQPRAGQGTALRAGSHPRSLGPRARLEQREVLTCVRIGPPHTAEGESWPAETLMGRARRHLGRGPTQVCVEARHGTTDTRTSLL